MHRGARGILWVLNRGAAAWGGGGGGGGGASVVALRPSLGLRFTLATRKRPVAKASALLTSRQARWAWGEVMQHAGGLLHRRYAIAAWVVR